MYTHLPLPSTAPALSPDNLFSKPRRHEPVLYIDQSAIAAKYKEFKDAFPTADIHYAMKCNPTKAILQQVKQLGGNFEIASYAELEALLEIDVDPALVLYSNPVKSSHDIQMAYKAGLRCFAFQSEDELHKLAKIGASDIKVYVRLVAPAGVNTIASEGKFGQPAYTPEEQAEVIKLMTTAKSLGLEPYGIAFHVGSQMEDPHAWLEPLRIVAALMRALQQAGIRVSLLDIGGGFPAYHNLNIPPIKAFGTAINKALAELPYPVKKVALEPGRALVSDAGALVAEVYGVAERGGQHWVYISVGAFNGLMEALESNTALRFPMVDERQSAKEIPYIVSGPSCDSQDTVAIDQMLSADLREGDRIIIYTAGAYSTAYASRFNGFPPPVVEII